MSLISRGFPKRSIARLEPRIHELAQRHLRIVVEQGSFDFVGDYAAKVPTGVIFELIDANVRDRREMAAIVDLIFDRQ